MTHWMGKGWILIALWALATRSGIAQEQTTILLIPTPHDHPPQTHMYREGCELLARCLNQTEGIEAIVSPEDVWPADESILERIDALVLYTRPGGDLLLDPDRREQTRAMLARGIGLTAIHWSTQARASLGADYQAILGGWFNRPHHSRILTTTAELVQVAPDHPICQGWSNYQIRDEFYLDLYYEPEAEPLLKVNLEGRDQVVGWVYQRPDGGRSFGTTLGHFFSNFTDREPFRRALVNGILWTADREIPEQGAPVDLEN